MYNSVVVGYSRSPFAMANKGKLIDVKPVNLLAEVIKNLISQSKINPAEIEDVVVKENQRGKGIGKLLVNNLIEKAKKNNCDKIILSSSEKNLKYYQKLGFQKNEFEMIMRI